MKLISWNVNGLRACLTKGFEIFFQETNADIFCIQETKMQQGQTDYPFTGYHQYWNSADKKGYSGTAVFSKQQPISVHYDIDHPEHTGEGRAITLEFENFYLVTVYTPNSQRGLARLDYRIKWEAAFRTYIHQLDVKKPVIICGDLNVAHQEIDLKNPKANQNNAGFSLQERKEFDKLLGIGLLDTYRSFYPNQTGAYSWWSYLNQARTNNVGWRIDYFLASKRLQPQLEDAQIYSDILGSDHCPIGLTLKE